jgi:MFS family permease
MFLLTTLFLQQGLGLEPVFAGMVTIPFALSSAVSAWLGGRLVTKYGRRLVVAGLALALVGFVLAALAVKLAPTEYIPWVMGAALLVAGAGGGFVISPNQTLTLADIPVTEGGVAGSIGQLGQRVGTALGVAAASAAFFAALDRDAAASVSQVLSYQDAFIRGFLVCAGLVLVALVIAFVDLVGRVRAGERIAA